MLERAQIRAELNISRKLLDQLWKAPTFDRAAVEAVNGHLRGLVARLRELEPARVDRRIGQSPRGFMKTRMEGQEL